MPTLYPQLRDIRWGPDFNQTFDVLRNPRRIPGGNPVLVYSHGGGATLRDKRLPWIASGNGNPLAYWCSQQTDPAFDVISIGRRQASWDLPLTSHPKDDDYGWRNPTSQRAVYGTQAWAEYKLAILAIKSRSEELGINPDQIIVMGTSYGADVFVTLACSAPLYSGGMRADVVNRYGIMAGLDSTVAGIIPHEVCVDFRNTFQEHKYTVLVSNLTYTEATRKLSATGLFATYDMIPGGGKITVTAGTSATLGDYQVDRVDQAGDYIILDRSIGSAANGSTDITITYIGNPPTLNLTGCTWTAATKTLTKTDAFKVYGHTGLPIFVRTAGSVSTGATRGVYTIAGRTSKDAITLTASPGADAVDYSIYSSGDPAYWSWFKDMFGAYAQADWDKIPCSLKRALSVLHYIETGQTDWWVPVLAVSEQTGDGLKPYGLESPGDPHDSAQVATLVNAARAKGLACEGLVTPAGWDDSDVNRDKQSAKILAWMKRTVEAAPRNKVNRGPVTGRLSGVPYS